MTCPGRTQSAPAYNIQNTLRIAWLKNLTADRTVNISNDLWIAKDTADRLLRR